MSFGPRDEVAAVESLLLRDRFLVDGEALAEAQDIPCFALSSDGKHMAYAAERRDSNGRGPSAYNWYIVTDGRDSPPVHADHGHLPFPLVSQLTLSFDGSRLAYAKDESQGSNAGSFAVAECVVVDGKAGPQYALAECATFSPDGKHFAYCAERYKNVPTTNPGRYATVAKPVWVVVTDGSEGREYDLTSAPVFSPDSRHLAYAAEKDSQWSIIADGKEIAVSGNNDDLCLRTRQFQAGGKRQGAAVRGMKRIQANITGHASGAADTGYHRNGIRIPAGILNRGDHGGKHSADAAAGAPDMRNSFCSEQRIHRMGWNIFYGF